jgi:DDE superfamily endonuclease
MFTSIPSLDLVLQCLLPVFTQPSFQTHIEVLLGWVMCLGKRTEYGVFQTIQADTPVSRKERHPFDRFYNFFSRSAWTVHDLAHQVAVAIVVRLSPRGLLYLVVDDTLLHKRGKHVYGLGWFRDAVASTAKRVATASGNHWVVVGLAICIPGTSKIYCLPIHAMLHLAGKNQKSEATLAKEMLQDILGWFPDRKLVFIGDGAYSAKNLLADLDPRVTYVGVMRADAALYDPIVPKQPQSKRGRKPEKGPRLPNPKEAVKKADGNRRGRGPWTWQRVKATAYGVTRKLQVLSFQAVWPEVHGLVPILVVLVRDPLGKFDDKYLFTTDVDAELNWVISTFSRRWSIEVTFKSSKQVMKIQAPQHWCQQSIEKLSPWVWLMQSVISLWYLSDGRRLPAAQAARRRFGAWDTEWSLAHMLRILRTAILENTISPQSATKADLYQLLDALENYLHLAA